MALRQILATEGCAVPRTKKEGRKKTWALVVVKVIRTSRGEQLLRWHWEEKPPKCISWVWYAAFLGEEQSFNMHDSHAACASLHIFASHNGIALQYGFAVEKYLFAKTRG
jgi:hypothetical protein